MIEVKVRGLTLTAYNGNHTTVNKGTFMYKAGQFSSSAGTHDPTGAPGEAAAGDLRMLPANGMTHSGYGVFPVNKIIFQTQGADQDLDTIASGHALMYYVGGQFETDEYDITVSGTGTQKGDKLWLNSSGQISLSNGTGAKPAGWGLPAIGEVVRVSSFPATSKWYNGGNSSGVNSYKKTVWYELYPWHANPAGNAMFR